MITQQLRVYEYNMKLEEAVREALRLLQTVFPDDERTLITYVAKSENSIYTLSAAALMTLKEVSIP